MASILNRLKLFIWVAVFFLASGVQQVSAEILPGAAERITQLSQSFHKLGLSGGFPEATMIASDMLFILEELERLSALADDVENGLSACGDPNDSSELSLEKLADVECLTVLLGVERARWRTSAELSAQIHVLARRALIETLPLDGLDELEEKAREKAEEWWRKTGPATLEAYTRIGREWIKKVENQDEVEDAKAEILDSLDRIAQEPGALRLRQVLSQTEGQEVLHAAFMPLVEKASRPAEQIAKLKAAAQFAGVFDGIMSQHIRNIYGQVPTETCVELLELGLQWGRRLPPLEDHCVSAVTLMHKIAADETDLTADAFQQTLVLAFEERILTMRLLLAKLGRVSELGGDLSCSDVMGSLNASLDDRRQRPLRGQALDQKLIEQAAEGFARLSSTCLIDSTPPRWLAESCNTSRDSQDIANGVGRMPESIGDRLRPKWKTLVEVANDQTLDRICNDPGKFLKDAKEGDFVLTDALRAAVEDLTKTSEEVMLQTSIEELRPFLDSFELPVQVLDDLVDRADLLCTEITDILPADPPADTSKPEPLTAQFLRETLVDIGVLSSDHRRPKELTTLCEVLSMRERAKDGTPLIEILKEAEKDVEVVAVSAAEVEAWVQRVMKRLNENGEQIATRFAAGVVVATGVDQVRQTLSISDQSDGNRRCNATGAQAASLAPGIRISEFTSKLNTSDQDWSIAVSAKVNLMLCGPIPSEQANAEDGVAGGQMKRAHSIGTKDENGEIVAAKAEFSLEPIMLDREISAYDINNIVEELVASARDAAKNIDIDDSVLLEALADYLRVAGIGDLLVLHSFKSDGVSIEFDDRGWARVRTSIDGSLVEGLDFEISSFDICLLLPVRTEEIIVDDDSCILIESLEKRVTEILIEQVVEPVLAKVLQDLGIYSDDAFESFEINPDIKIISGLAQTAGSSTPTVVSKIVVKSEYLKELAGFGGDDNAPFSEFIVEVRIPPDGAYEVKVTPPELSDTYFLGLLPKLTEAAHLKLSSIPKLPDGASNGEKRKCDSVSGNVPPRRIYRLALIDESPIAGVIGYVCFELKKDPIYVAPRNGELRTSDNAWRLVFGPGDDIEYVAADDDNTENLLRVGLELRVTEPSFKKLDGQSVAVEFNVATGAWRLPADERANHAAYSMIEEQLSRQLPQGVRVYDVEFSRDGIKLRLSPFSTDEVLANLGNEILSDVDLSDLQSALGTACEVAPLLGLAEMIKTGLKVDVQEICNIGKDSYDPLVHEVEIRSAEIAWSCKASEDNQQLSECDIVFDKELTVCEDRLKLDVAWDSSRAPVFEDDQLIECLEDHIASVFPDTVDPRIKANPPTLSEDCLEASGQCRLTTAVTADFSEIFEDSNLEALELEPSICGGLNEELIATIEAEFSFDGTSRIRFAGVKGDFDTALNQCVADISLAVAEASIKGNGFEDSLDKSWNEIERHGRELLSATSSELSRVTGEAVVCNLDLRDGSSPGCDKLSKEYLKNGTLRGARFVSEYNLFETAVDVSVGFAFELESLSPKALLDQVKTPDQLWKGLRKSAEVTFDLGCKDDTSSECLSEIGDKLAGDIPGDIVSYDGGLQVEPSPKRIAIKIPLRVKYSEFGLDVPVVVDCGLLTPEWNNISLNCSTDPRAVILQAIVQGLDTLGDVEMDLGIASVALKNPTFDAGASQIRINAVAKLEGLDLLQGNDQINGYVTIGRDLQPNIDIGWEDLINGAGEQLAEAVNGLVGDFLPVKIINVKIDAMNKNGVPTAIGIDSEATIIEVISLSAPRIVLSKEGLKIAGPNRFSIGLPDGLSIPVPPIAICPNGGAIEDKELTLTANITIGECTASGILKFAGSVTVFLDRPRVETLGKLVVLTVLPLGHSKGVFDLGERLISHKTEIGGVMSDIIRMRTEFKANGKLMTVTATGDVDVFKTRVGEGNFDLNLDTGVLNTAFDADIEVAKGRGFIRTGAGFSRPEAEIDGHMGIGGFPIMGTFTKARPRFVKVGISIFGLRLAVAFPGLDLLDPSKIADLLKELLTPNFENLDEALEALLSGNVTMNPFADFGSGGDGMGDSSDGEAGESAGGDGAKDGGEGDPGEGLGNEEGLAEANDPAGPPAPVPPQGVVAGGLAGTEAAPLWFTVDEATKFVRIGTGIQGGDDERVVVLAVHDEKHFDASGTRQGKTLVLLERGYTQILPSEAFTSEPCEGAAQQDRIVVVYAGTDTPKQGMYELCRLSDANGTPVTETFFGQTDKDTQRDVAALHDALAAELLSRSPMDGHNHDRILLKARLINEGGASDLRGVLAFQRPGELLVAMRGRFKESRCGDAAEPDESVESASKIFLLKGFGADDLKEPDTVLKAVRSVWGCDSGSLARFDLKTDQLATSTTIGQKGDAGFNVIAKLPEIETPDQSSSTWAAALVSEIDELKEELRQQEKQDQVDDELRERVSEAVAEGGQIIVPACEGGCEPVTVRFEPAGGGCKLSVNKDTFAFINDSELFKDNCKPASVEFTWLDLSPPLAILTTNPDAEPAEITLGLFNSDALATSNPLGFGIVLDSYTLAQDRFLSGLPDFVHSHSGQIGDLQSVSHPSGRMAAVLRGADGQSSHWRVLIDEASVDEAWVDVAFSGPNLTSEKAAALLPHIPVDATTVYIWANGDIFLNTANTYYLLRFDDDRWQLIFKLDRETGKDEFEDHVLANVSDEFAESTWKHDGRLVTFDEQLGGWGYAAVDRESGDGYLILKRVAEPEIDSVLAPIETWQGDDDHTNFEEEERFWFKLELPDSINSFRVTSVHSSVDSVICLYDADLNFLAGDDDSHTPGERSALLDFRTNGARKPAWIRITEFGKNATLPSDLVVSLKVVDVPGTIGAPRKECEQSSIEVPEPDYFGNLFINISVIGLSAAKDDRSMLATLANGVLKETLPEKFELIAVPASDGRKRSFATFEKNGVRSVLSPDSDTLEFKQFLTLEGDPPPNTGTLARAIGEVLSRFNKTERTLLGQSIVVEGVNAWSVTTVHNGEPRQVLFLEQGDNTATIALRKPNSDDGLLANIVRYVTTNGWPTVTDVQADPLILEVRSETCATAAASCPRRLVHLGADSEGQFPETVIDEDGVESPLYARWVEVFTDTVARESDAAFNKEVYEGVGAESLDAFRLRRDGPFYLVGADGWACADALGLTVRSTEMEMLLNAMTGNFDPDWQSAPATFCDKAHFKIDAGPAGAPNAVLLMRSASDGRFRLLRVPLDNPENAAVTESSVNLPKELAETVRDEFSARLRAQGAEALTGMDLLNESKLPDGRDIWVFGDGSGAVTDDTLAAWSVAFMYPNPAVSAKDAEKMLPCMMTGVSVALPNDTDGDADVIEAALVSIRKALQEVDTCIGADSAVINVRRNLDGGFSAFFQEIQKVSAPQVETGSNGIRVVSVMTSKIWESVIGMLEDQQRALRLGSDKGTITATFDDRKVQVDLTVMHGLTEPEQSDLMRQIVERVDALSQQRPESTFFTSLELVCETEEDCSTLTGRWGRRGWSALHLDPSGLNVKSTALALHPEPATDIAIDLALQIETLQDAVYEVLKQPDRQLAASVSSESAEVFFRETSDQTWQKLGEFPATAEELSQFEPIREGGLRRILDSGLRFRTPQWLLKEDSDNSPAGVAIAFERSGMPPNLLVWETVMSNGSNGPSYWRDEHEPLPMEDIIAHVESGKLQGGRQGLWLPLKRHDESQLFAPLAAPPTTETLTITSLNSLETSDVVTQFSFLPKCEGSPDRLKSLVLGLSKPDTGNTGTCAAINDDLTLLISKTPTEKGLVAIQNGWQWFDVSDLKSHLESTMHAFAVAVEGPQSNLEIKLAEKEGRVLGFVADQQVWWKSVTGDVARLGRFENVEPIEENHQTLLSRVAGLGLLTPPDDGEVVSTGTTLRADLSSRRTAILTNEGLVDLRTFKDRTTAVPPLPDRYEAGGIAIMRQHRTFPVVFDLDSAGTASGKFSMGDPSPSWHEMGELNPALAEEDAKDLADMLIKIAEEDDRRPSYVGQFPDSSFVACKDASNETVDVFKSTVGPDFVKLGIEGMVCDYDQLTSDRIRNAFALLNDAPCATENALLFMVRELLHLGLQKDVASTDTGCLFVEPFAAASPPICEHFPVRHPARDQLAQLYGEEGFCNPPKLTDKHALVERDGGVFLAVSHNSSRPLRIIEADAEFVRSNATALLHWVTRLQPNCDAKLTVMRLDQRTNDALLEDPCHGMDFLDEGGDKEMLLYEPATRPPMAEDLMKKIGKFADNLRDLGQLKARMFSDFVLIKLRNKDILALHATDDEIRMRASLADATTLIGKISSDIEIRGPTNVLYSKVEDPTGNGGSVVHIATIIDSDQPIPLSESIVVDKYDYKNEKTLGWSNGEIQKIKLGFALFNIAPISTVAYEWLRQQSLGKADLARTWLGSTGLPKFFVILRDNKVLFRLIDHSSLGVCRQLELNVAKGIIENLSAKGIIENLSDRSGQNFFLESWPDADLGEPGWYKPLNQDPRLALYDKAELEPC